MLTFLHHSDPTIPHYRNKQWSFLRGAISTVDRPLLGWAGRFFLHNVSHDHISHHLFSSIPFCTFTLVRHFVCPFINGVKPDNQPQVTEHIKSVLKDDYNYDSTVHFNPDLWSLVTDFPIQNTFRALYRTFTECCFIEDDGDIVFYKNKDGKAARVTQESVLDLDTTSKRVGSHWYEMAVDL